MDKREAIQLLVNYVNNVSLGEGSSDDLQEALAVCRRILALHDEECEQIDFSGFVRIFSALTEYSDHAVRVRLSERAKTHLAGLVRQYGQKKAEEVFANACYAADHLASHNRTGPFNINDVAINLDRWVGEYQVLMEKEGKEGVVGEP